MIRRFVRALFHLGGWLLTPIAAVLTAALGSTLVLLMAPGLSSTAGLVVALLGGLVGAAVGLWLWLRLLRRSPALQDVLAVTPEGVPTRDALEDALGPDSPDHGPDR